MAKIVYNSPNFPVLFASPRSIFYDVGVTLRLTEQVRSIARCCLIVDPKPFCGPLYKWRAFHFSHPTNGNREIRPEFGSKARSDEHFVWWPDKIVDPLKSFLLVRNGFEIVDNEQGSP